MADPGYVRSTDGSDADDGSTWALANATVTGAITDSAAGNTIYLSQSHSETTASAVTLAFTGTLASPTKLICANDGAEPPTAVATTAIVAMSAGGSAQLQVGSAGSQFVYAYGVTFTGTNGTGGRQFILVRATGIYDSCAFTFGSSSNDSASDITVGNATQQKITFKACGFKFAHAGQGLTMNTQNVVVDGGSLLSGGTSPTAMFRLNAGMSAFVSGFDLSNASAGVHISNSTTAGVTLKLRDCKLPASWSGSLNSGTPGAGSVFEMVNCDSADTHYAYRKATQLGTIVEETTLVRTGGANDGTTTISYKMVTNANAEYPLLTLDSPEIVLWNDTVGSGITITAHILRDSATNLTDAEVYLEVMYLGTSGVPLGSFISDAKADILATAADQAASSETWTTTGMSNPNKQKCAVTFTPQEVGYIHATLKVAKASTTLYLCPKLDVS